MICITRCIRKNIKEMNFNNIVFSTSEKNLSCSKFITLKRQDTRDMFCIRISKKIKKWISVTFLSTRDKKLVLFVRIEIFLKKHVNCIICQKCYNVTHNENIEIGNVTDYISLYCIAAVINN